MTSRNMDILKQKRPPMAKSVTLPDEIIISKIYFIRSRKVMLDRETWLNYMELKQKS